MSYEVKFYRGDYRARQMESNSDGAVCYIEGHYNGHPSTTANYAMVVIATNASSLSERWGRAYSAAAARKFGIRDNGTKRGGWDGRGNGNLIHTAMPAILVEPFFITNPKGSEWAMQRQDVLASLMAVSIMEHFPGGLVAMSVGHKYKTSHPSDRGVKSHHGKMEADLVEPVMERAATILRAQGTVDDPKDGPILADEIPTWGREPWAEMERLGIFDGSRPHDPITRLETATVLYRTIKHIQGESQ